jgi:hypothetical protein
MPDQPKPVPAPTPAPAPAPRANPNPPPPVSAEPAPDPHQARQQAALAVVAEYKKANPDDTRSDEQLLVAPNGGYEIADLGEDRQYAKPVLLQRLAQRKVTKPAPEPPPAPAG